MKDIRPFNAKNPLRRYLYSPSIGGSPVNSIAADIMSMPPNIMRSGVIIEMLGSLNWKSIPLNIKIDACTVANCSGTGEEV